jgi:adenylosuccinate synthase
MVINPYILLDEIDKLGDRPHARIFVSDRAHIITPELIAEDQATRAKIGTTGKGIGPTYRDKALRVGIRAGDFIHDERFDADVREKLYKLIKDTGGFLGQEISLGGRVLFEGAQGAMLDIDMGTYPFVTSSNTTTGGLMTGSGVFVKNLRVIGVAKAYTTRVGNGPFPTKLTDEIGERLRAVGHEYGTTTGRPRDCGWLDLKVLQHAKGVNGLERLALTKLDVLTGINPIRVCVDYVTPRGNKIVVGIPQNAGDYALSEPIYLELPGWTEDITGCRRFRDLPVNARRYVSFIERELGVPIQYIGVGPERTQIIERPM